MSSWKTHQAHETIINKSYKNKLNKNTRVVSPIWVRRPNGLKIDNL